MVCSTTISNFESFLFWKCSTRRPNFPSFKWGACKRVSLLLAQFSTLLHFFSYKKIPFLIIAAALHTIFQQSNFCPENWKVIELVKNSLIFCHFELKICCKIVFKIWIHFFMEVEFSDKNWIFGIVWVLQANTILQNQIIIKTVKATKKLEAA